MPNIFDGFLKQVAQGDQIRDFRHASKLFIDDNYRLSPKNTWLYHVYFDLNPSLINPSMDNQRLTEHGMLVKSVNLPNVSVQNKTLNEYNRPNVVQTKVTYAPVQIVFHDDMGDVIRALWYDYFKHYYRDNDIGYNTQDGKVNPVHYAPSLYSDTQRNLLNTGFGYTPRRVDSQGEQQYIQAIRIYSLHQKRFTECTLINPIITAVNYSNHDSEANRQAMDITMTVSYETALYAKGSVTPNTVRGFADLHYDKAPSPLTPAGGGTKSILGPGGIISAADEIFRGVESGTPLGIGSAAFNLMRAVQQNKNVDFKKLATAEIITAAQDAINGKSPLDRFGISSSTIEANFPGISQQPTTAGTSGLGAISNGSLVNAGTVISGAALVAGLTGAANPTAAAAAIAAGGAFLSTETGKNLARTISGAITGVAGKLTGGSLNQVYNVTASGTVTSSQLQTSSDVITQSMISKQFDAIADQALSFSPVAFQTGTNQTLTQAQSTLGSALRNTPYSTSLVPASSSTIATEAAKFIQNGNPIKVSATDRPLGTSTPSSFTI